MSSVQFLADVHAGVEGRQESSLFCRDNKFE